MHGEKLYVRERSDKAADAVRWREEGGIEEKEEQGLP